MTTKATAALFERTTNELLDAVTTMLDAADEGTDPLLERAIGQVVDLASTFNSIIGTTSPAIPAGEQPKH